MLYLKHNECAAAYGAGAAGSACVCVCVYAHVHAQAHALSGGSLIMHKKGGEVYFKAIRMLCHVAAGQHQQPHSNLPAQGPRGLLCCPAVLQPGGC